MSTRRTLDLRAAVVLLIGCTNVAVADDNQAPASATGNARPVPVRVISVQPQEPAPAELVRQGERESIRAQRDDEALIAQVVARPQPAKQAASELDTPEILGHAAGTTRLWEMSVSAWEAPAFCHRPLYFEDENLERHGRSWGCLQPAASTVHFAGRTLAFPYLVGAIPPHECIYTLGRERPGTCAAYRVYRPPVSAHGAATAGATAAGLSFIVP